MADGAEGSAATTAVGAAPSADGVFGRLGELAWRALPAIGSAVGFVGFVAIIGGAIEWIRFDAANLPATQAVLAVPKQELVVIGTLALGVFVIGAMLAVVVVYLIDSNGNATPRTAYGLVSVGVIEMAVILFFIGGHSVCKYLWVGIWLIVILFVAGYVVGLAMRDFRYRTKVRHARRRVLAAQLGLAGAADALGGTLPVGADEDKEHQEARLKLKGAAKVARKRFERAVKEWEEAVDRVICLQGDAMPEHRLCKICVGRRKVKDLCDFPADKPELAPGRVEVEAALDEVERRLWHAYRAVLGQLTRDWVGLKARLKKKKNREPAGETAPKDTPRSEAKKASNKVEKAPSKKDDCKKERWQVVGAGVFAVAVMVVGFLLVLAEFSWVAILIVVVVVLTAMNVSVARATQRFALYGVAVFFSVLLFGAGLTIARTLNQPKVQPVALLRKGRDLGMCGVYITQTNDRVYVGRLNLPQYGRPGLIFWVPTSEVELVSVGQPRSIETPKDAKHSVFASSAEHMLARLYKERAEEAPPALKNKTISEEGKKPASKKQAKKIHGLHVVTNTETSEAPPEKLRSKPYPRVEIYGKICTATQHIDA